MIISVHFAKTGGTSFSKSLEAHFGPKLQKDYDDFPMNTSLYERHLNALQASVKHGSHDFGDLECIHGHFLPLKYLLLSTKINTKFIGWMRDPVERLASHYWFLKKIYKPETAKPLDRRVTEEAWSLERFCLGPEFKNYYGQFLWGFPLERFDFIGIAESYDEDFKYFTNVFLGIDLPVFNANVGQNKPQGARYVTDANFRQAIETHHREDVELYRRALETRSKRAGVLECSE